MVRKLFLGAHFKMPFYCCPSLDVSIRESPILSFPFFTGFSSFSASSSGGTSTRLSLEFFCYSFSHIEQYYFEMHTSKKPSAMPIVQPHQNKFSPAKCSDKCNELCSNNSQCDDICNSKACADDNLDCNEKLPKLVSLFFLIS